MCRTLWKIRLLPACCLLSITFHILSVYAVGLFGRYDFRAAVQDPAAVTVELGAIAAADGVKKPDANGDSDREEATQEVATPAQSSRNRDETIDAASEAASHGQLASLKSTDLPSPKPDAAQPADVTPPAAQESQESEPAEPPTAEESPPPAAAAATVTTTNAPAADPQKTPKAAATALAGVGRYLASKYEKLSYRISMHGIPVATAELEAKNEQGMTSITMRVTSNQAISSVFPVDDLIESRQMGGLYLMTKIRQHEGDFRSDETFTINLRKKTVTWYDLVRPRIMKMTVPSDDVLDSLSAIYYLRNRELRVGKTETLHVFDSESYAEVPVEVLRREELRLPNLAKVATLVVRPLQKTAGIFRRTGEVQIWMTDDQSRVPVRIETSMALGKVTAELVSVESQAHGEPRSEASRRQ